MSVMLWDVHAHLDDPSFDQDRDEVVARASRITIINAGQEHESNLKTIELSIKYPNVRASLGFHPVEVNGSSEEAIEAELRFIESNSSRIVGISEIGLDYKYDDKRKQRWAFERLLSLAERLGLPAIIHSRRAAGAVLDVLSSFRAKVVLHAFSGNEKEAKRGLDMGYFFSIAPSVVYSKQKQRLVELLPMDRLLTESDSPVLGPVYGERNEPININIAIERIALAKRLAKAEVEEQISRNAESLFTS